MSQDVEPSAFRAFFLNSAAGDDSFALVRKLGFQEFKLKPIAEFTRGHPFFCSLPNNCSYKIFIERPRRRSYNFKTS